MGKHEFPSNRRRSVRVLVNPPIKLKIKESSSKLSSGKLADVINLQLGGLSLISKANLPVSSTLILSLESSSAFSPIEMRARVIWRNSLYEEEKFQYGAQFLELEEEQLSKLKKLMDSLRGKVFIFEKTVYLTDTNAEGNTYFSRYFDWQGMAREEFVRTNVPGLAAILQSGVRIITVEAYLQFIQETVLFNEILIDVKTSNIKRVSLDLIFTYTNKKTNQLIAKGRQKLAFADATGRLIPIPEEIRENAMYFLFKGGTTQGAKK